MANPNDSASFSSSSHHGNGASTTVNPAYALTSFQEKEGEYIAILERFLARCYGPQLERLYSSIHGMGTRPLASSTITAEGDGSQSVFAFSVRICAQRLMDHAPVLATWLFRFPELVLPLLHRALASQLIARSAAASTSTRVATLPLRTRQKLKVRVEFLPPVAQLRKPTISTIRSSDTKRLIQVAGTVVRTGMIKMQETQREVVCASARCQYRFFVKADLEQGNILELPRVCPSDHSGDSNKKACKSTQFDTIESSRVVSDHQVIKIQEHVSKLGVGSIPRSILVVLEEDLVDAVKAGDHVVVVGVLMRSWRPCIQGVRCDLETLVRANSIRVQNATSANVLVTEELKKEFQTFWKETYQDAPMRGRDAIVASVCPKVYGLFVVKLALALTIVGGCAHVDATGMRTRGESHMLLIGDPGTGKSQFLRFAAELSPRSVLTTGIGTTSAGLTCTAVKDGTEWMLEAGALVLADRGVCCIDEFSSIRVHDRASIHEAMEQQTLSVAKAGLVCKLNARTTIFAVTNPKGRYDPNADVAVNTSIASPLLSRFDLILVLLDTRNAHWDEIVSSFILQQSTDASTAPLTFSGETKDVKKDDASGNGWSVGKLQAYICYVKDKFQPQLTRPAMTILQRYYQLQRANEGRSAARTTIRLLESLTRLSQAHARLMFHDHVETMDAVVAVFLMEVSKASDSSSVLLGGGLDSVLHSDFPDDPTAEYALQEKMVLEHLGLCEFATVSGASSQHEMSPDQKRWGHGYEEGREEEKNGFENSEYRSPRGRKRPWSPTGGSPTTGFQWRPPGASVSASASSARTRWSSTRPEEPAEPEEPEEAVVMQTAYDDQDNEQERGDSADSRRTNHSSHAVFAGIALPAEESSQTAPRSQSSWRAWTEGAQSRVARWSQSTAANQAGGETNDDTDRSASVTSKWWRRP